MYNIAKVETVSSSRKTNNKRPPFALLFQECCSCPKSMRSHITRLVLLLGGILFAGVYFYLYMKSGANFINQLSYSYNASAALVHGINSKTTTTPETTTTWPSVCPESNITFVSAFFDFGNHPKGGGRRTVEEYYPWSAAFGRVYAPLVFYTDSEKFGSHVQKLRAHMDPRLTHVISVNRSTLWPFEYKDVIARLYARKDYPKHAPNTVVPEYSCSMHAKYACLYDASVTAWFGDNALHSLDRHRILPGLTNPNISYCVTTPKEFDENKVLFNQVYMPNFNLSPRDIFYGNHVWVGGGMFIATREVMLRLCDEYKRAATFLLLNRNLSSTDQQTLYASMTVEGKKDINLTVDIAVIPQTHDWFDLGKSLLRNVG
ncbi:LOW QUALITY PROTEIN: uncharacterized protein LOC112558035 [Pomacea canaliculata]|uniref:LOW QUALITY PROTEIN: uncharacterized protein LOC112558035 n=1 Tax=Pomacea canaliculata TaxID=400727 RepID=UPI000D72BA8A|nr:LOW QUALITY PROTEIN: uncharacterized protein LOC112558035 [Pomacea canaliculata]